jgi:hypothetical protein
MFDRQIFVCNFKVNLFKCMLSFRDINFRVMS